MEQYIIISQIKQMLKQHNADFEKDLKNIAAIINKIHKKHLISPLELVVEREIQGITLSLQQAINMLFDIEECIIENGLNYKFKHIIYCHKTDSENNKYSLYEKLGISLIDSRNRLNAIKKTDTRFLVVDKNDTTSLSLNNLFVIYEDYIDSWNKKDYEYVNAFLNNLTYKEVAQLFNINTSNAWRKERKLKMKQYYTIKELILSNI